MILSAKQLNDLHQSIANYLTEKGLSKTLEEFLNETQLDFDKTNKKYDGLLTNKWGAVVRLQQRVMELEKTNGLLEEKVKVSSKDSESVFSMANSVSSTGSSSIPKCFTEKFVLAGHRSEVTRVIFHPIFSILASSSQDSTIRLWNYETGVFEQTLHGHTDVVQDISFSSNGKLLVSCSADLRIKIWDMMTNERSIKCINTFTGHTHTITSVCVSPSSQVVYSGSRDQSIQQWSVNTGYSNQRLTAGNWIRMVRIHDDGTTLAACGNNNLIQIWELKNYQITEVLQGHDHIVECVAWGPPIKKEISSITTDIKMNGSKDKSKGKSLDEIEHLLASGSRDRMIKIWNGDNGTLLFTLQGHNNWVREVVFMPFSHCLLSASDDKTVKVWDLVRKHYVSSLECHSHFCTTVALHPNKLMIATGGVDKLVKIWQYI
ncbi:hypothetical protein SNEBB_011362 [Seison nebaliae]|nr:hypothetical protein SNEBB_011362 [Seison nebaliae]